MTEAATAQRLPVDWAWINERLKLPIFEAVGVSLGYELGTLAPVGRAFTNRPFVQPPEDYRVRVATTYEAVQMGLLQCNSTDIDGASFDPRASFDEGQFWEVSTVEFRRFCDERGWQVPAEFRPNGYASKTTPSDDPAPVVTESASTAPGNRKVWTPERLAELKAYRATHGTRAAAAHYKISPQRVRELLPRDKPKPKGYSAFTHRQR